MMRSNYKHIPKLHTNVCCLQHTSALHYKYYTVPWWCRTLDSDWPWLVWVVTGQMPIFTVKVRYHGAFDRPSARCSAFKGSVSRLLSSSFPDAGRFLQKALRPAVLHLPSTKRQTVLTKPTPNDTQDRNLVSGALHHSRNVCFVLLNPYQAIYVCIWWNKTNNGKEKNMATSGDSGAQANTDG